MPPPAHEFAQAWWALACIDTHLPKALRLVLLVPYLARNATRSVLRSVLHAFAALTSALTSSRTVSRDFDDAFCETHFPCALAPCLPVPYLAVKAAGSAVASVLHSLAAFCFASLTASAVASERLETHLPNALRLVLLVP